MKVRIPDWKSTKMELVLPYVRPIFLVFVTRNTIAMVCVGMCIYIYVHVVKVVSQQCPHGLFDCILLRTVLSFHFSFPHAWLMKWCTGQEGMHNTQVRSNGDIIASQPRLLDRDHVLLCSQDIIYEYISITTSGIPYSLQFINTLVVGPEYNSIALILTYMINQGGADLLFNDHHQSL